MSKRRKKRKSEIVYMAVSIDEYEWPINLFFSIKEIQQWTDKSYQFIKNVIRKQIVVNDCKIIKIDLNHDKKADN